MGQDVFHQVAAGLRKAQSQGSHLCCYLESRTGALESGKRAANEVAGGPGSSPCFGTLGSGCLGQIPYAWNNANSLWSSVLRAENSPFLSPSPAPEVGTEERAAQRALTCLGPWNWYDSWDSNSVTGHSVLEREPFCCCCVMLCLLLLVFTNIVLP